MKGSQRVLLIDGGHLIYRAWHAYEGLENSQGEASGMVFGSVTLLFKFINHFNPLYTIVCWDAGAQEKKIISADYKANRTPKPPEFMVQVNATKDLFNAMGVWSIAQSGFEADTLIGAFCYQEPYKRMDRVIVSGDSDLRQLVTDIGKSGFNVYRVQVYDDQRNKLWGFEEVCERYKIQHPLELVDYKALAGDAGDGVKGVPGIGVKGAIQVIDELRKHVVGAPRTRGLTFPKDLYTAKILRALEKQGITKVSKGLDKLVMSRQLVDIGEAASRFLPYGQAWLDEFQEVRSRPEEAMEIVNRFELKTLAMPITRFCSQ